MRNYDFVRNSDVMNINEKKFFVFVGIELKLNRNRIYVKSNTGTEKQLYEANNTSIHDLNMVKSSNESDTTLRMIWRENFGLSQNSEVHYAEISSDLKITKHVVIDSKDTGRNYILPLGVVVGEFLIFSGVSLVSKKIEVTLYEINTLERVTVRQEIESGLHSNYFSENQHVLANLTLTLIDSDRTLLQFIAESGTIYTYQAKVDIENTGLIITRLFDFAYNDIGFHRVIFNRETNFLIIVYSEKNISSNANNIMIAQQQIFPGSLDYTLKSPRIDSFQVNQSMGRYLRPYLVKRDSNYFIAWEGNEISYTVLSDTFDIVSPESNIQVNFPGNVIVAENDLLILSCQSPDLVSKDMGENFITTELAIN